MFYNGDDTIPERSILRLSDSFESKAKDDCLELDTAIDYCIENDIMREILLKHKAEVARLIFREFDEAEYMRLVEKDTERQIAAFKEEIALQKEQLSQQSEQLSQQSEQLAQKDEQLIQKDEQLEKYKRMLEEYGLLTPDK